MKSIQSNHPLMHGARLPLRRHPAAEVGWPGGGGYNGAVGGPE